MYNNQEQSWKRDCESKAKYELDNTFEVQEFIKPGSNDCSAKEEVKNLGMKDRL
jgi:hypothetical protein